MPIFLFASRLLLAGVFLLAGATKLADPRGWRNALRDFSLPAVFTKPAMVFLPLVEISVALAMFPAALAWYGARGAFALLVLFMLAVVFAMIRGRKPDCHCFGQLHSSPVGWRTLVRNIALAALAGWISSRHPGDVGPGLWNWYNSLGPEASKFALLAAGAALLAFFWLVLQSKSRPLPAAPPEEETVEEAEMPAAPEQKRAVPSRPQTVSRPSPPAAAPARVALGIGLPVGTAAPDFELPTLSGQKRSLRSLLGQGRDVLLVFSSPFCKPCESIPSNLVRWVRGLDQFPNIVLVSAGKPDDIRPKLKEFGTANVLLQKDSEVSERYDVISTPTAVLVGADGLIRTELATGGPAIKQLLSSTAKANHLPTR